MMDYWIDFLPGDTLLLYTDGVVEARRDREFYGRERLEAGLLSLSQTSAESCVNAIFHSVRHFAANQLRDDVALLLLSRPLGAE
jgi:serine phosphatase RsbU (regulator of sigma subunit)